MTEKKSFRRVKTGLAFAALVAAVAFIVALIPFRGLALASASGASPAPRAISVTFYDGPLTRGFTWRTDRTVEDGQVQIIQKRGSIARDNINWESPAVVTVPAVFSNGPLSSVGDISRYRVWKANYTFQAGRTYYFRVGSPTATDGWSEVGRQVIDDGSNGVRLINVTDSQGETAGNFEMYSRVLAAAFEKMPDAHGFVINGDLVEHGNNMQQWNWFLDTPQEIMLDTAIIPVAGNHEDRTNFFSSHFNIRTPEGSMTTRGKYYSLTIGNVHMAVLNTNDTRTILSAPQVAWLRADLAAANANPEIDWTIVALHEGVKVAHRHSDANTIAMGAQILPIMAEFAVDLVLQGHDHTYTRTNPFAWSEADGNTPVQGITYITETINGQSRNLMVEPDGTVYMLINRAGDKTREPLMPFPSFLNLATKTVGGGLAASQPGAMFGTIRVEGSVLLYEAFVVNTTTGAAALYDYFGVVKNHVPEVAQSAEEANTKEYAGNDIQSYETSAKVQKVYAFDTATGVAGFAVAFFAIGFVLVLTKLGRKI